MSEAGRLRLLSASTLAQAVAREATGAPDYVVATEQSIARWRDALDRTSMRIETADNGRIALERLARSAFDLVLMDCRMPEMDGYEATRRLSAVRRGALRGCSG
ncbi:MAG: response regulator [Steroidobacteraceae bacterium]|jgi:response regulator RpfG family c-di-GMP phosphodiesterase|nr:response regulator [Steroidobacteraceae bacterium]